VEARGALEQGADDLGVGYNPALAHGVGEVGVGGDPVLDGAAADAEVIGHDLVGGADEAVVAGEFAIRGIGELGLTGGRHLSILVRECRQTYATTLLRDVKPERCRVCDGEARGQRKFDRIAGSFGALCRAMPDGE
jgi:hypothetical protein